MKRSAEEAIEVLRKKNQLPQYSLLNCVHCSGLLSSPELQSFKRSCRFDKLEEEFNDDCEKDPCLRERFKNIFNANFYSEREARCMKRSLALNARKIKNVKSGKGKWRRAFASQQQAIEKRKELLYNRYVERQEAFCELQVAYTCAELKDSPIILVPYDVKISDTSDDIQDEQLDENVPVTIVAVNEDIREQSAKQLSRFNGQCFVTGELIKLLVERDREELLILNNITSTTSHSNFTAIANEASYHRALSLMPLLAEKVVVSNKHIKQLSPRTLLLWFNKFEKSKYRGFEEDLRGSCKKGPFYRRF